MERLGVTLRRLLTVRVWCCARCWRRQPYSAECVECGYRKLFPVGMAA